MVDAVEILKTVRTVEAEPARVEVGGVADRPGRRKYKHAAEGTVGRSEAAASEFYLLCKLFGVSTGYVC